MKLKNKFSAFLSYGLLIIALLFVITYLEGLKEEQSHKDQRLISYGAAILICVCGLVLEEKIKKIFEEVPILKKFFFKDKEKEITLDPIEANRLKKDILRLTKVQCKTKLSSIIGPEMVGGEFPNDPHFVPGVNAPDDNKKWKEVIGEQFSFITGKKGSGKSIELIHRVSYYTKLWDKGVETPEILNNVKVPVYIELTSLNRVLDEAWIVDYIHRSAEIAEIKLDPKKIKWLLTNKHVIYFFDGLDEILPEHIAGTVQKIVDFKEGTGVMVSCRKDLYEKLLEQEAIPRRIRPAEWFLKPLSLKRIRAIIEKLTKYSAEEKLELVHFIVHKPNVLEHLSRPILFNLFALTYPHLSPKEKERLEHLDFNETLKVLWEIYEDLIVRKKLKPDVDVLNMRTYTMWLARIMGDNSFFVESIQPSWLRVLNSDSKILTSRLLQKMFYLITRIIAAVVVGLAMGCIIATPFALVSNSILGGLTIALFAGIYNSKLISRVPARLAETLFPTVMMIGLVTVCGGYQGFSVPRYPHPEVFSIPETWPGILLGFTLSIIFSYRIILEKNRGQYILPVEIFHFDWTHAFRYGFTWGFISAAITGTIGVVVKITNSNAAFMNDWLVPQVRLIASGFTKETLSSQQVNTGIFLYGFFATFMVASLIIVVLAGRFSDLEQDVKEKQKLNYAIKESFRHALKNSAIVAAICAVFYMGFTFKFEIIDIVHSITFPLGMFLMAFLWFGGMEGFNHILLRANLFARGIAPEDYTPWVKAHENMGLIIPTGFQMKFYHPTLAEYYGDYPLEEKYDVPRLRLKRTMTDHYIYYFLFLLLALTMFFPLYYRYIDKAFWRSRHEINIDIKQAGEMKRMNDSTYQIQKSGIYRLSASGFINVGTFVGWVWPWGTPNGFMGMPIGKAYNIPEYNLQSYKHAALLFRGSPDGRSWCEFQYVAESMEHSYIDTTLSKGDYLQFIVNDKEYMNNSGHYRLSIKWFDPAVKPEGETSDPERREKEKHKK